MTQLHQHSRVLSSSDLETLLESSGDAIFSKDLDNIVVQWSRGAEKIYGYTRAEMVGQSVTRLLPPDRPNEAAMILERIKGGERLERWETIRRTKDGSLRLVLLTVSPLREASGVITGALTVARDITEARLGILRDRGDRRAGPAGEAGGLTVRPEPGDL